MIRLASIAVLSFLAAGPVYGNDGAALDLSGYELTFTEDFEKLDVSAWGPNTRWIAHTPWAGDFGDAVFSDPSPRFPFTIEDGILRIEARKSPDNKWHSGLLASVDRAGNGFSQQFGYFEMRGRFPPGKGLWPAFWLIGLERLHGSMHTAEIDIIEHYGHAPERYTVAVHLWDRKEPANRRTGYRHVAVAPGALYDEFHTFGVLVDAELTRFYFDRREVWRTKTMLEHHQPMFILLNLGAGGGWQIEETPSPSFMYVDYVRVWTQRGGQTR